jgi:V-type H+-transporting ATPase subunit C
MSYSIVSISNAGGAPEKALKSLQDAGSAHGEMFKFEVPSLMVGTLDTLMTLSDEMHKTDALIESVFRKVEKTGIELASYGGKSSRTEFTVGGVPATRYIQQFAWDYAKYPNRRPLKELVSLISGGVSAIDEELKQLCNSFADKAAALSEAKRKKGSNLLTADLNDVLTQEVMRNVTIHNTEYLKTLFIAVPSGSEEEFLTSIENVGSELVGFGGPDWSRNPRELGTAVKLVL